MPIINFIKLKGIMKDNPYSYYVIKTVLKLNFVFYEILFNINLNEEIKIK